MAAYAPVVTDVYQSRYGYWVVVVSVAPWLRMPVMVAKLGLTSEDAASLVLGGYTQQPARKQATCQ